MVRAIQLGEHRAFGADGHAAGALSVLASVPVFLVAATQEGWAWVTRKVPFLEDLFTRRTPYRQVPLDDDGESVTETKTQNLAGTSARTMLTRASGGSGRL